MFVPQFGIVIVSEKSTQESYASVLGYFHRTWVPKDTSRAARGGGGSFKNRKRIGEIGCFESRMTKQKH